MKQKTINKSILKQILNHNSSEKSLLVNSMSGFPPRRNKHENKTDNQIKFPGDNFSDFLHLLNDGVIILDNKYNILNTNSSAVNLLELKNYTTEQESIFDLLKLKHIKIKKNELENLKNDFESYEFNLLIKVSGETRSLKCHLKKGINKKNEQFGYVVLLKDISNTIHLKKLNNLAIIENIEAERKRLSYDLHDSFGQELNAIKLYLSTLESIGVNNEKTLFVLKECRNSISNSINTIKNICFNLLPKCLENGSFLNALDELVFRCKGIYNIDYNFPKFDVALCKTIQINLYRIIQEFINNSIKHSNAKTISININLNKNIIGINISDDGCGFNFKKVKKGNGLINIYSRLEVTELNYSFNSYLNKGTSLKIFIENKADKNTYSR